MVGSACLKLFKENGYNNLLTKSSKELDLRNQEDVKTFLYDEKPDVVIHAAARVGGILANKDYPYEFLMDNMLIQNNLIRYAHELDVSKFIFLGSSCIYPKMCDQPIKEDYLLSGPLEPTNQWYAIAKISGVKLIEALNNQYSKNYVALMPTNLYGPNDNFDINTSHVLPAMINKFYHAKVNNKKSVTLWGTGKPKREFLHVNDLATAIKFSIENKFEKNVYNVGSGDEIDISSLAELVKEVIGYNGIIKWDEEKPDGTPRKLMDSSQFTSCGWKPRTDLTKGIESTYEWYKSQWT